MHGWPSRVSDDDDDDVRRRRDDDDETGEWALPERDAAALLLRLMA